MELFQIIIILILIVLDFWLSIINPKNQKIDITMLQTFRIIILYIFLFVTYLLYNDLKKVQPKQEYVKVEQTLYIKKSN